MGSGSRIDRATGRKQREKSAKTETAGPRPQRWNGAIVPKGRLANKRAKGSRS